MKKTNRSDLLHPDLSALLLDYGATLHHYIVEDQETATKGARRGSKPESKLYYDFGKGPAADCALATALAHKHFGITLQLDSSYLCPRIASRYLYVEWLEQLLKDTQQTLSLVNHMSHMNHENEDQHKSLTILDIGVGSSCIYPLLIASVEPQWQVVGTDISSLSLSLAQRQLELNPQLSDRIELVNVSSWQDVDGKENEQVSIFFSGNDSTVKLPHFDACLCNPPFYDSLESITTSRDAKQTKPSASARVFQAKTHELVTKGGEYSFVLQMIKESEHRQALPSTKTLWYTSMVGHKSSLIQLVGELKSRGIDNYVVHELTTSQSKEEAYETHEKYEKYEKYSTRRWVIGWSFGDCRPPRSLSCAISSALEKYNPESFTMQVRAQGNEQGDLGQKLDRVMTSSLDFENNPQCVWKFNGETRVGMLWVDRDIWSRAYRRGQSRAKRPKLSLENTDKGRGGCEMYEITANEQENKVQARVRFGNNLNLLQSLVGLLQRNMNVRETGM